MTLNEQDKTISVDEAVAYTTRWRKANPDMPKAFSFSLDEITTLIGELSRAKSPAMEFSAIRFYLGINDQGIPTLVMVGVNGEYDPSSEKGGTDVLMVLNGKDELIPGAYDFSSPCPYLCSGGNSLNGNLQ